MWQDAFVQAGFRGSLSRDAVLADYTTFKIGGKADLLLEAGEENDLVLARSLCAKEGIPLTLIGRGSNLLIRDGGIRGLVVVVAKGMQSIRREGNRLVCEAGASLGAVSHAALEYALQGLAFASGIPGSLGGAVVMNAGAYGGEMKDVVESVRLITENGEIIQVGKPDLAFAYRDSALQSGDLRGSIVTGATLLLSPGDREQIRSEIEDLTRRRREKQPLTYPSAGSAFKRPAVGYAAEMIEKAGCKGLSVGDAQVSTLHAGFIINTGRATAKDTIELFRLVQKRVYDMFGVQLEWEVRLLGEDEPA